MQAQALNCGQCQATISNSSGLLAGFHDGFAYWAAHDFQNPNWWDNQIGYGHGVGREWCVVVQAALV